MIVQALSPFGGEGSRVHLSQTLKGTTGGCDRPVEPGSQHYGDNFKGQGSWIEM